MIILTSYGFRSPFVCTKIRKYINPKRKSITIIPFARPNEEITVKYEKNALEDFGFSDIHFLTRESTVLNDTDYIYVPGGDTFRLLHILKETGLLDEIKRLVEHGKASYIGVSAGAYMCCKDIEYVKSLEDDNYNISDYTAMGLITENIVCHSDQISMGDIASIKSHNPERPLHLIRNDDVYFIEDI